MRFFAAVVTGNDVRRYKPAPEAVLEARPDWLVRSVPELAAYLSLLPAFSS
ncbi:MAG TPA: hypothetical protein GXX28_03400 [Firmicutes bacterium]|nr:hypothetical protein [Bacillota bacterium]